MREEEGELNAVLAGTMDARLGWRVDVDDVCFVAKAARPFPHPARRSRAPNIRGPRGRCGRWWFDLSWSDGAGEGVGGMSRTSLPRICSLLAAGLEAVRAAC